MGAAGKRLLLTEAEAAGFEAVLTTDRNLRYQQNLAGRNIAIVVSSQRPVDHHQAAHC